MLRGLLLFVAGWYFGRNRGATSQLLTAGQTLLDQQGVLPDTGIVSPEQVNACPQGYTWWEQYQMCLSPKEDAQAREAYAAGVRFTPRSLR